MTSRKKIIIGSSLLAAVIIIAAIIILMVQKNSKPLDDNKNNFDAENSTIESETSKNNTEQVKEKEFKVLETTIHTPKIKLKGIDNSEIVNIPNKNDYDFYVVVVSAVIAYDNDYYEFDWNNNKVISGLNENEYYVKKHITYLTDEEKEKYNCDQKQGLNKVLYVIEYAIKKGTTPNVKLIENKQIEIMNITDINFTGKIVESGVARLWDTMKIKDEYGTEHYLIAISNSNYYNNWGYVAKDVNSNGYAYSTYSFDLVQVGDCENVPTDLSEVLKFYWNLENTKFNISYGNFKYASFGSAPSNNIVTIRNSTSTKDITKLTRDNNIFKNITIDFITKGVNTEPFNNKKSLKIKLSDIVLTMDDIYWQ